MATTTKVITCCVFFFALYFNRISGVGSKNIVILDSLNSKEFTTLSFTPFFSLKVGGHGFSLSIIFVSKLTCTFLVCETLVC